ncbi:hypothetical protein PR048_028708 [Dryococelus australis]|uniref:Uncharacterized protein n=1 Tax=Dryococelus australis TaxID=614101 RepID=A0ABQ9GE45_9NEOP|nr:hypothetical protein PR048_028708 [Dryococelus australis]
MRMIEVSMEQRRNERAGEKGDPRENQQTNDTISTCETSGATRQEIGSGSPCLYTQHGEDTVRQFGDLVATAQLMRVKVLALIAPALHCLERGKQLAVAPQFSPGTASPQCSRDLRTPSRTVAYEHIVHHRLAISRRRSSSSPCPSPHSASITALSQKSSSNTGDPWTAAIFIRL